MLRRLMLVALLALLATFGLTASPALALQPNPPDFHTCTVYSGPYAPTYVGSDGVGQWSGSASVQCSGSLADVNVYACMFVGDNLNSEFCQYYQVNNVNGSFGMSFPNIVACFASGFHWWGERVYIRSRKHTSPTVLYNWTTSVRSIDSGGVYGQCRL